VGSLHVRKRRAVGRRAPRLSRRAAHPRPRAARRQLNRKQKKGDEDGLEYRAAFNLLLDLCFGDSLRAWNRVDNWFYLHAGARAPAARRASHGAGQPAGAN